MSSTSTVVDKAEYVRQYSRYATELKDFAADRRRGSTGRRPPTAPTVTMTRRGGSVSASRAASRKSWGDGFELSHNLSATRVRITDFAHESLRATEYGSGFEIGGLLFGKVTDEEIVIYDAFQNAPGEHRDHVRLDFDEMQRLDERAARVGRRVVGDFHSHEYFDDLGRASEADRRCWALSARRLNIPHVGMILSPWAETDSTYAWLTPKFSCWLASEENFQVTIAPAQLTVGGSQWD